MGKRNAAKRMKQGSEVNLNAWFEEGARGKGPQLHAIEGGRGWHPDDADNKQAGQRAENGRTQRPSSALASRPYSVALKLDASHGAGGGGGGGSGEGSLAAAMAMADRI